MTNRLPDPFEISRSATPRTEPGVWWVECLKGQDAQKFLVYSAQPQGLDMHWIPKERRTVPCFVNQSLCPGGHSEKTRKWRCYVFAHSYKRHKNVFVQLTKDAWDSWIAFTKPGVSLRGQTIVVHRTEKDNGRLWVEVESWREERRKDLPGDEDCKKSVFALWRFDPSEVMLDAKLSSGEQFLKNGHVLT
jgi:hypothetical protein